MPACVPAYSDRFVAGYFCCIGFRSVYVILANTTVASATGFTSSIWRISFLEGEVPFVGRIRKYVTLRDRTLHYTLIGKPSNPAPTLPTTCANNYGLYNNKDLIYHKNDK